MESTDSLHSLFEVVPGESFGPFYMGMHVTECIVSTKTKKNPQFFIFPVYPSKKNPSTSFSFCQLIATSIGPIEFLYDPDDVYNIDYVILVDSIGLKLCFNPHSQLLHCVTIDLFIFQSPSTDLNKENPLSFTFKKQTFASFKTPPFFSLIYDTFGPTAPSIFDPILNHYLLQYEGLFFFFSSGTSSSANNKQIPFAEIASKSCTKMVILPKQCTSIHSPVILSHSLPPPALYCTTDTSIPHLLGITSTTISINMIPLPERRIFILLNQGVIVNATYLAFGSTTDHLLFALGHPDAIVKRNVSSRSGGTDDGKKDPYDAFEWQYRQFGISFILSLDILDELQLYKIVLHMNLPSDSLFGAFSRCFFDFVLNPNHDCTNKKDKKGMQYSHLVGTSLQDSELIALKKKMLTKLHMSPPTVRSGDSNGAPLFEEEEFDLTKKKTKKKQSSNQADVKLGKSSHQLLNDSMVINLPAASSKRSNASDDASIFSNTDYPMKSKGKSIEAPLLEESKKTSPTAVPSDQPTILKSNNSTKQIGGGGTRKKKKSVDSIGADLDLVESGNKMPIPWEDTATIGPEKKPLESAINKVDVEEQSNKNLPLKTAPELQKNKTANKASINKESNMAAADIETRVEEKGNQPDLIAPPMETQSPEPLIQPTCKNQNIIRQSLLEDFEKRKTKEEDIHTNEHDDEEAAPTSTIKKESEISESKVNGEPDHSVKKNIKKKGGKTKNFLQNIYSSECICLPTLSMGCFNHPLLPLGINEKTKWQSVKEVLQREYSHLVSPPIILHATQIRDTTFLHGIPGAAFEVNSKSFIERITLWSDIDTPSLFQSDAPKVSGVPAYQLAPVVKDT